MLFTAVSCHLGCSKTPTPIPQPEPAKPEMYITSLSLKEFPGVETEIDNSSKTIYMTLPYGAKPGKATLVYETNEGVTGSPESGSQVDITAPVQIFLKDAEGNACKYVLTVSVGKSSSANLRSIVNNKKPEDTVTLTVYRPSVRETGELTLTLSEYAGSR